MAQTFASGKFAYLVNKLSPGWTITLDRDIGVTAGRLYLQNDTQVEWIDFTGNVSSGSYYVLSWVSRNMSQTANPSTAGTDNKTWLANQKVVLVAMHDQLFNPEQGGTIAWATIFNSTATFNDPVVFTESIKEPVYANAAARDAAIPSPENWMSVYLTAEWYFSDYQAWAWWQRSTGTSTVNASTTVAGKVELPTTAEVQSQTTAGGTWASLVLTIDQFGNYYSKWDGSDGNVTISVNTTLTRDMFYNNLTVNTGRTLDPDGYAIYVAETLTLTGTAKIARNGNAGSAASGATGWAGGTALNTNTCWACLGWVTGANWGTGAWANWTQGTAASPSYSASSSVAGWAGWASWGTPWGNWGTANTSSQWVRYNRIYNLAQALSAVMTPARWIFSQVAYQWLASSGSGWAGWGAGVWANWGGGGWSGGNGGNIFIYANIVAGSGTVEAKWGAGWAGWAAPWINAWWGGGGGWGCGWVIYYVYNSGTPHTLTVTWGTWWAGWAKNGTGSDGVAGTTGASGVTITLNK